MKTNYFSKTLAICLTSILLFSCESHEKKADGYIQSKNSIKVSLDEKNGASDTKARSPKIKKTVEKGQTNDI